MSPIAPDAEHFDRRYRADPDPWSYDGSPYEHRKYARTLAALPDGEIGSALELGCSIGAFTELLAERCDRVLAVDFSPAAVRLARQRTADLAGVRIEQQDLREGLPPGPFDLIVCSEVLYYWPKRDVASCVDRIERSLARPGALLAVHWRGEDPGAPMHGDAVHRLIAERSSLERSHTERHEDYLLDRWERLG